MNCTRRRLQKHRRAAIRTPAWRSNGTSHVFRWSRALDLIECAAVLDGVRGEPLALGAGELASFVGRTAEATACLAGAPPWFVAAVARRAVRLRLADELDALLAW
jgi:hypothetical protein